MKRKHRYTAFMVNGDHFNFEVEGENDLHRDVRCNHFLTQEDDTYFFDKISQIRYNKKYIIKVNYVGEI